MGVLQFDVAQHRLKAEYGASVAFERLPYVHARWIEGEMDLDRLHRPGNSTCLLDVEGRPLALFATNWEMRNAQAKNPDVKFIAAVQPGRSSRSGISLLDRRGR